MKIFTTTLYRARANDYWGFAITDQGEFLIELNHKDETTLKHLLSDPSIFGHDHEIIYINQFDFETDQEFKQARMKSLHTYANSTI